MDWTLDQKRAAMADAAKVVELDRLLRLVREDAHRMIGKLGTGYRDGRQAQLYAEVDAALKR